MAEQMIKITLDIPESTFDFIRDTANLLGIDRAKLLRPVVILGCGLLRTFPGLLKHVDPDLIRK